MAIYEQKSKMDDKWMDNKSFDKYRIDMDVEYFAMRRRMSRLRVKCGKLASLEGITALVYFICLFLLLYCKSGTEVIQLFHAQLI